MSSKWLVAMQLFIVNIGSETYILSGDTKELNEKVYAFNLFLHSKCNVPVNDFKCAVHHHKETVETNYALSFDGSGDHIVVNGGTISNAWSFEFGLKKLVTEVE